MSNKSDRNKRIIKEMKECVQELDLSILNEKTTEETSTIFTEINQGPISMHIQVSYLISKEILGLLVEFSHAIHTERIEKIYDLNNLINKELLDIVTICVCPNTGIVSTHAGIFIPKKGINKEQLKISLNRLFRQGFNLYGLVVRQDYTDSVPEKIVGEYIRNVKKLSLERKYEMINNINHRHRI